MCNRLQPRLNTQERSLATLLYMQHLAVIARPPLADSPGLTIGIALDQQPVSYARSSETIHNSSNRNKYYGR